MYFDRSATQSTAKRGGSAGMDRPSNAGWVLPQAVNSLWWNPGERRGRRGARLTRRVREEYLVYFDRNATMSGAKRRGSAGWIAGRTPPGFHHRLLSLGTLPAGRNVPPAVWRSDPSLRHRGLRPTASKSRRPAGRAALTYRGSESHSDAERNLAVRHMENSHSRITSQGQVSIPVRIRRKLGLTPGSTVEWCERGSEVVVRRATRFSSLDIHQSSLPVTARAENRRRDGRRDSDPSATPAYARLTRTSWSG